MQVQTQPITTCRLQKTNTRKKLYQWVPASKEERFQINNLKIISRLRKARIRAWNMAHWGKKSCSTQACRREQTSKNYPLASIHVLCWIHNNSSHSLCLSSHIHILHNNNKINKKENHEQNKAKIRRSENNKWETKLVQIINETELVLQEN